MKTITFLFFSLCAVLALTQCGIFSKTPLAEGIALISNDQAKCVLVDCRGVVDSECGNGVSPLLKLYEERLQKSSKPFENEIVVDKVIGRAAAFIIIKGHAEGAYGLIVSEEAQTLLKAHHIDVGYETLVPQILNRKRDGLCPLEQSVAGCTDPDEALRALKAKIESFKTH